MDIDDSIISNRFVVKPNVDSALDESKFLLFQNLVNYHNFLHTVKLSLYYDWNFILSFISVSSDTSRKEGVQCFTRYDDPRCS